MIIVTYEDRPKAQIGLKLLLASLARHSPGIPVCVASAHNEMFHGWARRFANVKLVHKPLGATSWDIKPTLLLRLLDEGHEEVVWIDADIIATGDIGARLGRVKKDALLVTEEAEWPRPVSPTARTEAWKLAIGRAIRPTINSCVLRVTPAHRKLLVAWEEALASRFYLDAQRSPWYERPIGTLGDQDVLEALLGSEGFAHLTLEYLSRGAEIVQYMKSTGYLVRERIHNLMHGDPLLVHCQGGPKPWERRTASPPGTTLEVFDEYYQRVCLDTSPYALAARALALDVGEPLPWLEARTAPGKVMRQLSFGKSALTGLPQAAIDGLVRGTKRLIIGRQPLDRVPLVRILGGG
jgi:hypothetical protein